MNIDNLVIETDRIRRIPEMPMKTYTIYRSGSHKPIVLLTGLLLLWFLAPKCVSYLDETAGSVDQSIWLLILLSMISFLILFGLCWWVLKHAWHRVGLPSIYLVFSEFKTLSPWQQLHFFLASFALVLAAALTTMIAII